LVKSTAWVIYKVQGKVALGVLGHILTIFIFELSNYHVHKCSPQLPIDVEVFERREQLKKSGLGKVVTETPRLINIHCEIGE
jgi:hypothetical protein